MIAAASMRGCCITLAEKLYMNTEQDNNNHFQDNEMEEFEVLWAH